MTQVFLDALSFVSYCALVNVSFNVFYELKLRKLPSLRKLDRPFDCGLLFFDGRRILGESTTWGGLVLALTIGGLFQAVFPGNLFFLKAILVFFGHAMGSFIKRRLGLPRGFFLPILNHGDYVLLTGIVCVFLENLSVPAFFAALVGTLVLTPLVTITFYRIGWRDNKL